jgi:UDP-3-O-acyl-N-acetylglucosamine deacetylase
MHTCRHTRNTLHKNKYNTLIYNQNYNVFRSHVSNNSISHTKTLGFVGDILAVREKNLPEGKKYK